MEETTIPRKKADVVNNASHPRHRQHQTLFGRMCRVNECNVLHSSQVIYMSADLLLVSTGDRPVDTEQVLLYYSDAVRRHHCTWCKSE